MNGTQSFSWVPPRIPNHPPVYRLPLTGPGAWPTSETPRTASVSVSVAIHYQCRSQSMIFFPSKFEHFLVFFLWWQNNLKTSCLSFFLGWRRRNLITGLITKWVVHTLLIANDPRNCPGPSCGRQPKDCSQTWSIVFQFRLGKHFSDERWLPFYYLKIGFLEYLRISGEIRYPCGPIGYWKKVTIWKEDDDDCFYYFQK